MEATFEIRDGLLVPGPAAVGVWSDDMVDGHQVGGIVGWGALQASPGPDFQLARLTVDMFRAVPMRPLRVEARPVREGRRIHAAEITVLDGEVEVTRGSALWLVRGEDPGGVPWSPPDWEIPAPLDLPPPQLPAGQRRGSFEVRRTAEWGAPVQGRVWLRESNLFVEGQDLAPALRAALAADFAHPLANGSAGGLGYINADITMYLARDPVGEWVGLESIGHVGDAGVAVGSAWLYDEQGRIGSSSVCATPDPRLRQRVLGSGQGR